MAGACLLPGCGAADASGADGEEPEDDAVNVDDAVPLPVDIDGVTAETGEGDIAGSVHEGSRIASVAVSVNDTVTFGDVALLVPEMGEGLAVAIHYEDGTAREIEMRHVANGVVELTHLDPAAMESDVKLNDLHYRWYAANKRPRGCRRSYSVEAVATHEFGHVFGLGHVSEGLHGNLTMSTHTGPCSGAQSSLGLGDVLGLRSLY